MSLAFWAEVTGAISGLVLLYPAFRVSGKRKTFEDYRRFLERAEPSPDLEHLELAVQAMHQHLSAWDRKSHMALIAGLLLFILSFFLKLVTYLPDLQH